MVALAGMKDSGKTSLLARILQQFQDGPVGSYDFAGSRTMLRFEELNWLSTVESRVGSPKMERTSHIYDNTFLHLTVLENADGARPVDLLLNDISGETYPDAIAAQSVCEQLVCLRRADHLAVLVDGEAIADWHLRHDQCDKARDFVQRALQTGQIGKQTVLHLVISKLDAVKCIGDVNENFEVTRRLNDQFASKFQNQVAKLHQWEIAARPKDGSLPTYDTIAKLFTIWVATTYRYANHRVDRPTEVHSGRDFCRIGSTN